MRKSVVICVLMMTLVLTACGGGKGDAARELALTIRTAYVSAGGCTGRLELTADYGQRVYTYTVDLTVSGEETVLTLTAPEEVAGVTARVRGTDSWLEFDGTVLETGPLSDDGLSPLSAVPVLLDSARSGFMDSCTLEQLGERETLRVLCRDPGKQPGEGRQAVLWFDPDSGVLIRGEILMDGYRVITCECLEFTLN